MNSRAAACLDDIYDRLQWAGEEYILEELEDELGGFKKAVQFFPVKLCTGQAMCTDTGTIIPENQVRKFTVQQMPNS